MQSNKKFTTSPTSRLLVQVLVITFLLITIGRPDSVVDDHHRDRSTGNLVACAPTDDSGQPDGVGGTSLVLAPPPAAASRGGVEAKLHSDETDQTIVRDYDETNDDTSGGGGGDTDDYDLTTTNTGPTISATTGYHQRNGDSSSSSNNNGPANKIDYYDYRHVFADGVQRALDECREKFKWERWNCPKKAFLSILDREEFSNGQSALPSNKELGLTRALLASSIVLSMVRSCSLGNNHFCGCANSANNPPTNPFQAAIEASELLQLDPSATNSSSTASQPTAINSAIGHHQQQQPSASFVSNVIEPTRETPAPGEPTSSVSRSAATTTTTTTATTALTTNNRGARFIWAGCEEVVRFGFKVARIYLDSLDVIQNEASRLINAHNYRVGLQAVRKTMKRRCKCHGASGACQVNTCWTVVPELGEVADFLKRQYGLAAKVGASSARETDAARLAKELAAISPEKLVFADASPDYCYENKQLGINGTLERYCSRAKTRPDGNGAAGGPASLSQRNSCDRLCTRCGYKIKKVRLNVERQCDCRFVYCCSVKCKRCPHVEEAYKCVKHS